MARSDDSVSLSALARLGFAELSEAAANLTELATLIGVDRSLLLAEADAADPDAAVEGMLRVARRDAAPIAAVFADQRARRRAWRVFGSSQGFADFFLRHPTEVSVLADRSTGLPSADELRERMLDAVGARDGFADSGDDSAVVTLRVAYRRNLALIAAIDLTAYNPVRILSLIHI